MVKLIFYNSETGKNEHFIPLNENNIGIYVCGPTVYDHIHIGNARPLVIFDVLVRLLRHVYPNVTYVRNITDIDDKIIARASENKENINDLTQRFITAFHHASMVLGCTSPDHEPKATDHINDMIAMITQLINRGYAYEEQGHVLFHVPLMADYGKFANRSRDDLIAGARVDIAPYKRDDADFVLWKPAGNSNIGWDSPWGIGRPGWHIECSAMSKFYLGKDFDIHGGGLDLIFPHHQNEIAQSRCACDNINFANYWLHNGYVLSEGQKMSKSLGNFYTVDGLSKIFKGEALRLILLRTHYRQPLDFRKENIVEAQKWLDKFYDKMIGFAHVQPAKKINDNSVMDALANDLNTPLALTELQKQLETANTDKDIAQIKAMCAILGILLQPCAQWFNSEKCGLTDIQIEDMMTQRQQARKNKDFILADKIRDDLAAQGIIIRDTANGAYWRKESN